MAWFACRLFAFRSQRVIFNLARPQLAGRVYAMIDPHLQTLSMIALLLFSINQTLSIIALLRGFAQGFLEGYDQGVLEREEEDRKNGKA